MFRSGTRLKPPIKFRRRRKIKEGSKKILNGQKKIKVKDGGSDPMAGVEVW